MGTVSRAAASDPCWGGGDRAVLAGGPGDRPCAPVPAVHEGARGVSGAAAPRPQPVPGPRGNRASQGHWFNIKDHLVLRIYSLTLEFILLTFRGLMFPMVGG